MSDVTKDPLVDFSNTPYGDGSNAGYLIGKYAGATDCPPCPYPEGTPEHDQWWMGFGDATDVLWYGL